MLFTQDKEWIKKGTGLFDVTMGCYEGAEFCQLVGTFVLEMGLKISIQTNLKVASLT